MTCSQPRYCTALLVLGIAHIQCVSSCLADDDGIEFFENNIRPILVDHCYECHSSETDEPAGGLLLDTRDGIREGGETGPAVVPEDVDESLLISAIEYSDLEMPPDEKLDDEIIAQFREWIEMGAPDPRDGEDDEPSDMAAEPPATEPLWSLQPLVPHTPPQAVDWSRSVVDQFVFERMKQAGLQPARQADPVVLLRRLSFDLVGLPPEQKDIHDLHATADERRNEFFAQYVDRLLASPQYGERWARHWLDVARYGESAGSSRDVLMLYSWRYRDYVIDAFNGDIPWPDFVRQQVAGDLLPADTDEERRRNLVATGLLAIGSKSLNGGNLTLDIADDQIDVVSKAFMGLTVSCARCHDHKFDPIPTADYYALAGIFRNTQTFYGGSTRRPGTLNDRMKVYFPLSAEFADHVDDVRKINAEVARLTKKLNPVKKRTQAIEKRLPKDWKTLLNTMEAADTNAEGESDVDTNARKSPSISADVRKQLNLYRKTMAEMQDLSSQIRTARQQLAELPDPSFAFAVKETAKPRDFPIQIRGDRTKAGDVVPRGFLSCISGPQVAEIPAGESGRRQLAQWLAHPDHPLTSRVIVNRVWQHLFGVGLVETSNNFGESGSRPTHPELLDFLALKFQNEHRGSLKTLIRELVLTATYQQSVDGREAGWDTDPSNTLYWRANRRRLEAEAIRDAMLHAAGRLDLNRPEGSLVQQVGEGEVGRNIDTKPLEQSFPHRSVYLPVIRGLLPEFLKVFDFPEPSNPIARRSVTNVPTQSLFLMNSPFVMAQAQAAAELICEAASDSSQRCVLLWERCLSRRPTAAEIRMANSFLAEWETTTADGNTTVGPDAWTALTLSVMGSAEFRFVD
ncbi:MAG: PSD1 and planctomycete cytochrome C domain-containing protein [Planctomycetaceae bacterium]|nr:PSD1 and planctomycete cytochrome C domain-containing protein [Planctomycetaceae bacterium]